ncbi:DoxX family protein [Flaviaesturariibacter flavus]|uniref:DoxX family protein n=1 Tax=Flaviaesturariibacter flavus TaxID=2502780 RepID=A0A4R1B2U1_9BACT|nr:DoxX family protein [Flaviaesturariibacter flavus]TCJ12151.1 DoxX family protein [Flaviaesturariibacter flavus]
MKQSFFASQETIAPLFVRLLLGLVLFPHGAQKLFGWFGGSGFEGTMAYFTGTVGLPWIMGFLVILIEVFGSLFLIAGFATRLSAMAVGCVMLGIVATTMNDYFFMNWFGDHKSEGMEYFLLAIGMALSLVSGGAGKWSADNLVASRKEARRKRSETDLVPGISANRKTA